MRRHTPSGRVHAAGNLPFNLLLALVIALMYSLVGTFMSAAARQLTEEFSPASGPAHVIAQGVVELPVGDAVWRTVRTRALMPEDALFEERPLGFVLATAGPLLLVDQATGEQVRLGTGEAALVRSGTVQRRSSLGAQPASYLSIELVPGNAPAPPADATVLQPGQAFPVPAGLHDLDLLSATMVGDEVFTIPDSGAKNVVLVTSGAANVGRPDGSPVVLLAGEAASFSGELAVTRAPGGAEGISFVVAMIGPEVPPPPGITDSPPPAETPGAVATPGSGLNLGAITVEVFTCPPGMTAETVAAAACAPTLEDFDITISGEMLDSPLTLGDAASTGSAFIWSELPYGSYLIAEAVMPTGSTTYTLSARETTGDPNTGFLVTIDEANPELSVRIYNFAPG
jgi:hypothetical protein